MQIDAFHEWARREGGIVAKIFRVSETATKSEARREFRAMIKYAKKNAAKYAGILFYKIDRAARNMKDFVDLEELESKYNLPFRLISDVDKKVLQDYNAWGEKKMYGKSYMGILRKTYIINEEGYVEKIIEKVNTKEHSRQIFSELSH